MSGWRTGSESRPGCNEMARPGVEESGGAPARRAASTRSPISTATAPLVEAAQRDPAPFDALYRQVPRTGVQLRVLRARQPSRRGGRHGARLSRRRSTALPRFEERALPADGEGASTFRVWLFQIARNEVASRRRSLRRHPQAPLEAAGEISMDDPTRPRHVRRETRPSAHRAPRRLPADRRRALVLRFVDEMSTAEIAGVLGRSEGAVRVLIHRALRSVAGDLGGTREPSTAAASGERDAARSSRGRGPHHRPLHRFAARGPAIAGATLVTGVVSPSPTVRAAAAPARRRAAARPPRHSGSRSGSRRSSHGRRPAACGSVRRGRPPRPGPGTVRRLGAARGPAAVRGSIARGRSDRRAPAPLLIGARADVGSALDRRRTSRASRPCRAVEPRTVRAVRAAASRSPSPRRAACASHRGRLMPIKLPVPPRRESSRRPLDAVPQLRGDALQQAARQEPARLPATAATTSGCGARARLALLLDRDSFREQDAGLESVDMLGFVDQKPYPERLAAAQASDRHP